MADIISSRRKTREYAGNALLRCSSLFGDKGGAPFAAASPDQQLPIPDMGRYRKLLVRLGCGKGGCALVSKQGAPAKQGTVGVLGCAGFDPRRNLRVTLGALVVAKFIKPREAAPQWMGGWVLGPPMLPALAGTRVDRRRRFQRLLHKASSEAYSPRLPLQHELAQHQKLGLVPAQDVKNGKWAGEPELLVLSQFVLQRLLEAETSALRQVRQLWDVCIQLVL